MRKRSSAITMPRSPGQDSHTTFVMFSGRPGCLEDILIQSSVKCTNPQFR